MILLWFHSHKQMYDAAKKLVTSLVHSAKTTYFSTKIAESTTCKQLVGITNKLLSSSNSSPLPSSLPLEKLSDLCGQFFFKKVRNIRDQYDCNTSVNAPSPFNCDALQSLIKKCLPKSCVLDPIPTTLLLECLDSVMLVLTNIVNTSLTNGISTRCPL